MATWTKLLVVGVLALAGCSGSSADLGVGSVEPRCATDCGEPDGDSGHPDVLVAGDAGASPDTGTLPDASNADARSGEARPDAGGVFEAGSDGGAGVIEASVDSCSNGQRDPGEADIDCGGVCSRRCPDGGPCSSSADCSSLVCQEGRCVAPPPINAVDLIDDFEDGDELTPSTVIPGGPSRGGTRWYVSKDGTVGGTVTGGAPKPSLLPLSRGASLRGLHAAGGGFSGWGALVGVDFEPRGQDNAPVPFGNTAYQGISFWAMAVNPGDITVALSDAAIDTPTPCAIYCPKAFRYTARVTSEWQLYRVPFVDFVADSGALEIISLVSLSFELGTGPFDLWIDDIAFYY